MISSEITCKLYSAKRNLNITARLIDKMLQTGVFVLLFSSILSVNGQGVVGGHNENGQQCHACVLGACRTINGIYTRPDLPPGYSLVTQIPKGACGLHVQQIKYTRNILALRLTENSSFILNGDWQFGVSKSIDAAGTKVTYNKQDSTSLESISASGPLSVPLDIMIINYQANPGIKYRYALPIDDVPVPVIAPPSIMRPVPVPNLDSRKLDISSSNSSFNSQRDDPKPAYLPGQRRTRLKRRNFHWKVTGYTPCSKTCGGGKYRVPNYDCLVRDIPSQPSHC